MFEDQEYFEQQEYDAEMEAVAEANARGEAEAAAYEAERNGLIMNEKQQEEILIVGDFEMNVTFPSFRLAGKEIQLTQKEFYLMMYFMKNPNRELDRSMILDKVWGYPQGIRSRVADVYIQYLRKKIGYEYFMTIPWFGYKFVPNGEKHE